MTPRLTQHTLLIAAIGLAIPVLPAVAAAKQAGSPMASDSWSGTVARSVATKAGRITVYLPDDIRAGDTISGTVMAEPAGKNERERLQNSGTLEGMVIEIDGKRTRVGNVVRFVLPTAGFARLLIRAANGKTLSGSILNVGSPVPASPVIAGPILGQAGRPVTIPGNFDGNSSNTTARIGERPVEIIAESPRALVMRVPRDVVGPGTLTVGEAGSPRNVAFSSVAVNLSAGKQSLLKGESTRVTVQVEGLTGQAAVPPPRLTLIGSPAIRLEGGNAQSIPLSPGADGRVVLERQITGLIPGGFEVSAQVMAQAAPIRMDPLFPDALDMNGIDSVKELLGLIASMNDDARVALLRATLKALRQRHSDATDDDTRDWLNEKIRIVEGAMDLLGVSR